MATVIRATEILVNTPLQPAFNYVSDLSRHPEWNGGLKIEAVTPGPIGVGKEYVSHGVVAVEKHRPNNVRVSEYEPPHNFGFVAKDPDFGDVSHIFTLSAQNGHTLIVRRMILDINPVIAVLFRIFIYPLIGGPAMKKSMAALKMKLEENALATSW